jgi:hypothetical protein
MNDASIKWGNCFGVGTNGGEVKGEGRWIWSKYFMCVYENTLIKSIKIVLKEGGRG